MRSQVETEPRWLDMEAVLEGEAVFEGPTVLAGVAPKRMVAERYQLLSVLGEGAMGVVWKARDTTLNELVALKMMQADFVGDPEGLDRFHREVRLARRVTHRNVARVFDLGVHRGTPFITMELVVGQALDEVIAREAPMPANRVVHLALQICGGLGAAHAEGIVHRDLKPENLLLDTEGRIFLTDFGIARGLERDGTRLTQGAVGTPTYMAPEQVESAPDVDGRADIYAVGCVLFEMLTGMPPWTGRSAYVVASKRLTTEPPDPRDLRRLDDDLAGIVMRCMARDRGARFATIDELASALSMRGAATSHPTKSQPGGSWAPESSDQAIARFESMYRRRPGDPWVNHGYARALLTRYHLVDAFAPDLAEARTMAEKAAEEAPDMKGVLATVADALWELGDSHNAVATLDRARALEPNATQVLVLRGRVDATRGDIDSACRHFARACTRDASTALQSEHGMALALAGHHERAAALMRGLTEQRTPWRAWIAAARLAAWRGDRPRGLELLRLANTALVDRRDDVVTIIAALHQSAAPRDAWLRLREMAALAGPRQRAEHMSTAVEILAVHGAEERSLEPLTREREVAGLVSRAWLERCPLLDGLRNTRPYRTLAERSVL